MNLHKHARLTPRGRALLVERVLEHGLRVEEAAHASGVSVRTAYKWLARFREEGPAGLHDRSSAPRRCPHATPREQVEAVIALRRARHTYHQIAQALSIAHSTVARLLRRAGLHRLAKLEPAPPVNRYEHEKPGDLLHLDIKKLGRFWRPGHRVTRDRQNASDGAGWEYVHLAIDDHSRVAFATIEPDERGTSACRMLLCGLPSGLANRLFDSWALAQRYCAAWACKWCSGSGRSRQADCAWLVGTPQQLEAASTHGTLPVCL